MYAAIRFARARALGASVPALARVNGQVGVRQGRRFLLYIINADSVIVMSKGRARNGGNSEIIITSCVEWV